MADISSDLKNWSATESSNAPAGSTAIGTGMDDNLRRIQATVRQDLANAPTAVASAATTDLGAVASNYCAVSGTTTITSFGTVSSGIWKLVRFDGALTLTHNGTSLILPGSANITTAAGDVAWMVSEGSGNWRCLAYTRGTTGAAVKPNLITVNAQSGAYTVIASDLGKIINCTGTFTVSLTAAATLGSGFWCWIKNVSTGTITIDPNGAETISIPGGPETAGATITLPYSGSVEGPYNVSGILLWCDGANFEVLSTLEAHGSQEFTAGGTWTAPAGVTTAWITGSAGGGGGGAATSTAPGNAGAGGGGAGAQKVNTRVATVPGTAYTVTIGAAGAAGTAGGTGGAGGTTSLGALLSLTGGAGGIGANNISASGGAGSGVGGGGGAGTIDTDATAAVGAEGGMGGSGPMGGGGAGVQRRAAGATAGIAAGANSGAGGGGACSMAANSADGGSGGSGILIVNW